MDLTKHWERLVTASSETAYDSLAGYGFARRHVAGKIVADIGWDEVGPGSQLLAETAESVVGLTGLAEVADLARSTYPAPNAEYRKVDLPELPYPEDHFDVVTAFGVVENLERPEDLVKEARRVLKQDGVLIISVPDQRFLIDGHKPRSTGHRRGMYVVEFQEVLDRHFERALVYRQGAAAGGFIFPISGEVTEASVESTTLSLTNPYLGTQPPTTRLIMAVCSNAEVSEQDQQPYLLLDRDRRVYDECEDRAEDVELLRDEIRQMQETEVQAFLDAIKVRGAELGYLRARIRRLESEVQTLKDQKRAMENSRLWRLFEPYRQLRSRVGALRGRAPESGGGNGGARPG